MVKIYTTIFDTLLDKEKNELILLGKKIDSISLYNYIQKDLNQSKFDKFIFEDLILKRLIKNISLWDSFKLLLQKIYDITISKNNNFGELQIWVKDLSNPSAINISFSVRNKEDISNYLLTLRSKLESNVFSSKTLIQKGNIFWIAFNKEENNWNIKIL